MKTNIQTFLEREEQEIMISHEMQERVFNKQFGTKKKWRTLLLGFGMVPVFLGVLALAVMLRPEETEPTRVAGSFLSQALAYYETDLAEGMIFYLHETRWYMSGEEKIEFIYECWTNSEGVEACGEGDGTVTEIWNGDRFYGTPEQLQEELEFQAQIERDEAAGESHTALFYSYREPTELGLLEYTHKPIYSREGSVCFEETYDMIEFSEMSDTDVIEYINGRSMPFLEPALVVSLIIQNPSFVEIIKDGVRYYEVFDREMGTLLTIAINEEDYGIRSIKEDTYYADVKDGEAVMLYGSTSGREFEYKSIPVEELRENFFTPKEHGLVAIPREEEPHEEVICE